MSSTNYKVYFTYRLSVVNPSNDDFVTNPIHCNYINVKELETIKNKFIFLKFPNEDEFKFMNNSSGNTGFYADKMEIIMQIVPPNANLVSDKWVIFDVTDKIENHTVGNLINKTDLVNTVFEIKIFDYVSSENYYNIDYLYYPTKYENDVDKLCFGDEEYLIGNIETDIGATAYTTDIPLSLPTEEYNFTTNKTWTEGNDIYITEIGIYDENRKLVAIGKLNRPVLKNNKTTRTFVFEIDF